MRGAKQEDQERDVAVRERKGRVYLASAFSLSSFSLSTGDAADFLNLSRNEPSLLTEGCEWIYFG